MSTWADTSKACYERTLEVINRAAQWLEQKARGRQPFGAAINPALPAERRREFAAAIMPSIRGLISTTSHKVGHFDDCPAVLEFLGAAPLHAFAHLCTSFP